MKIAKCVFNNGLKKITTENYNGEKLYNFIIPEKLDIVAGQTAVVWCKNGLEIVKIVEVLNNPDIIEADKATQYVLSAVDTDAELARQGSRARQAEIKRILDKKLEEYEELAKYADLTDIDSEAASLLIELKVLKALE